MLHIGVVCLPVPGHLNPMSALGRELQRRGHHVTFFGVPDAEPAARAEGLDFRPVGASDHPIGSLPRATRRLGELQGFAAVRFTAAAVINNTRVICRDAPGALKEAGVEALLVDQVEPAGGAVAEHLSLPFVTVCNALAVNQEPTIPPFFTPWGYSRGAPAQLRNRAGYALLRLLAQPAVNVLETYRRQWNLPLPRSANETFSRLAQICQMPAALDFPRRELPASFHYTGPLRTPSPRIIPFPYERLDGRPLIYASLGTLQNRVHAVFRAIAEAIAGFDAQLVLTLGGGGNVEGWSNLPGAPIVVPYAPQDELLARATLTITHAGLNTVLDSLSHGVPMVAVPITNDQPGVGARLGYAGAGEVVLLPRLGVSRLRDAIERVLHDDAYRQNAARLQQAIRQSGGAIRAADIVEMAFATRQPVLANPS